MKKVLVVFLITIAIVACSTSTDGFTVNGKITGGLADSTSIYLKAIDSTNRLVNIDTTMLKEGVFTFTGNQDSPELHYIGVENVRGNFPVVLENGSITFKGQKDSLQFSDLSGTPQNDFFASYINEQRTMQNMYNSMQQDLRTAQRSKDTAIVNSLRDEFFELQEKSKQFSNDFIKENPDALVSALVLQSLLKSKA